MEYIIRSATVADLSFLYDISVQAHRGDRYDLLIPAHSRKRYNERYTWSESGKKRLLASMRKKFDDQKWFIAVAEVQNKVCGYTLACMSDNGTLSLSGLFVRPDMQGQGIGGALFAHSLGWNRQGQIELAVIAANTVATALYERFGFVSIGVADTTFYSAPLLKMQRIIIDKV